MILGSILSSVTSAVGGYLENKSKEAQAKSQLKQAEIQSKAKIEEEIVKGNADAMRLKAEWENKAVDNLSNSWRDEFVTLVVLTPCILVFFPSLQHYVLQGFDILKTLPSWYVNLIYITVCAGLGLKGVGGISKYMKRK
tara:strand:+ start:415 stop:831 length:417 start_codon:yes stop_codon:yes gene_type:complete